MLSQSRRFLNKAISYAYLNGIAILSRISKNAISRKTYNIAKAIKNGDEGPFLFVPYESPDCLSLHAGVAYGISSFQSKVKLVDCRNRFPIKDYIEIGNSTQSFYEFQEVLKQHCTSHGLANLYYALLDSIIRIAPHKSFLYAPQLKESLYSDLFEYVQSLKITCKAYKACFLADSAYLNNQIIKQIFIDSGRPAYYLNPSGQILRYSSIFVSEFHASLALSNTNSSSDKEVEKYLAKRFSGQSNRDLDSRAVFSSSHRSISYERKKILFLHAFRDANNNNWNHNQAFSSYYEWADYTLSIIHEDCAFNSWYIKQHPSSKYYPDEDAILSALLIKYSVPSECMNTPSTPEIIRDELPIYTNNGTIVLEAACYGMAAYFCGSRFDPDFGIHAQTKAMWAEFIRLPALRAPKTSAAIIKSAKYSLWQSFGFKNIPELCPVRPFLPGDNRRTKLALLASQAINSLIISPKISSVPFIL